MNERMDATEMQMVVEHTGMGSDWQSHSALNKSLIESLIHRLSVVVLSV